MSERSLEQLGKRIASQVGAEPERASYAELRARLVSRVTSPRPSPWSRVPVLVFAAATLLLATFAVLRSRAATSLTFGVDGRSSGGEAGAYFAPAGERPLALSFSDGSRVVLEGHSRARVARTTASGAAVSLETGRADVEVHHGEGTDWTVAAGPYSVHVTGTSFSVAWDPEAGAIDVAMRSGVVVVRGPGVEEGAEIRAGQHFTRRQGGRPEPTAPAPSVHAAVDGPSPPAPVPLEPAAPVHPVAHARGAAAAERWSELVAKGDYSRVVEAAEAQGIEPSLATAGAEDLGALADSARFLGRGELARRTLLAIRARFPGTGRASSAAFVLGRMAEEGGDAAGAVGWYERSFAEAPAGALAAEALGRKLVALRRGADPGAGRLAAEDYLRRFPGGPYAGIARDMTAP